MQDLDKLGGTAFPHTSVDPKTNDVTYHPGMPMWAWFFGQALGANTTSGSTRNVIEHAERIADAALAVYQQRLAPPATEDPVEQARSGWDYYGEIPGLAGEPLHIWRRHRNHVIEAAVTASKDTEPSEGQRIFLRLEDLASYHRVRVEDMEDFIRSYVGRR